MKNKEKKFMVVDSNIHEYDITVKEKKNGHIIYKLFRSNAEYWESDVRGEKCLSILVDDLDFKLNIKKTQENSMLPYHLIKEIKILLDFITEDDYKEMCEIIEKKVL